jgi:hypothetical protein
VVGHLRQDVVDLVAEVEEHLPLGDLDLPELGVADLVDACCRVSTPARSG